MLPAARRGRALIWRQLDGQADAVGANRVEAEAIVTEVLACLRAAEPPAITVACLSRAQQRLIEDLLDDERARDRALAFDRVAVTTPDRMIETRDVVLVSIGDGADSLGALAHPVPSGGSLRSSRAPATSCWSCRASRPKRSPLRPTRRRAPGAACASCSSSRATAVPHLADDVPATSPVTAAISRALAERGWALRHAVGSVELAVVDPDDPSRCVLAIEHDGAAYARTRGTRDRDRLRAQELARLGWRVHRVWTLDWWLDPERETQRAHGAIVAAVAAGRRARSTTPPAIAKINAAPAIAAKTARRRLAAGSTQPARNRRHNLQPLASGSGPNTAPMHVARGAIAIGPYVAAAIPPGRRIPDDMFGGRHVGELGAVIEQVLAVEAPIHLELLARRVGAYFGVGRITPEVVAQVRTALDGRGRFGDEADVVWRVDQDPAGLPAVRVAGASAVACRDIAQIPLFEMPQPRASSSSERSGSPRPSWRATRRVCWASRASPRASPSASTTASGSPHCAS